MAKMGKVSFSYSTRKFWYHPLNRGLARQPTKRPGREHQDNNALVERMLALHKSLTSAETPQEQESVQRQVESTDGGIDKLVYELSPKGDNIG